MRSTVDNAQLALLLEVSSTPKPGNVDRAHEYPDLRFEHFVTGAVGAREGLADLAAGEPLGESFETAIEGMAQQRGGNTQFGAILLLTPLLATATTGPLTASRAAETVSETTVADAAGFYRAFDHVDVAVQEPPDSLDALDVRRGTDAVPAVKSAGLTLADLMEESASRDGIAREWNSGFKRSFDAGDRLLQCDGPVTDRAAEVFLELLAAEPDTFVITRNGEARAEEVRRRAQAAIEGEEDPATLAEEFVERDINPGTTADIIAGGLFIALERGLEP
jgi:triphosphoribosyl-dephospho-CoA synthase